MLQIGERKVDPRTGDVHGPEADVRLTTMELALLVYLYERPGQLVSRDELYEQVWGYASSVRSRAADVALTRLRRKLEPNPAKPRFFQTVRGEGYRYDAPETPSDTGLWVGRAALIEQLRERRDEHVVIKGPGGAGKSSLVRRVLGDQAVWVTLDQGEDLRPAMALALGLQSGDDAAIALALEHRPQHLVLDGAESQVDQVSALLSALPDTQIWVTSRVDVPGVDAVPLPPLQSPEAAQLFTHHVERARGSRLSVEESSLVEGLVAALDHNCLAIELAAGRCGLLSVSGLIERLGDLSLLARNDEGPHGSMERVLATSWALLDDEARGALERLSLFSSAFTVSDAEAVGGDLAVLERLLDTSLLRREGTGDLVIPPLVRRRGRRQQPDGTAFARHMATLGDEGLACQLSPDHAIRRRARLLARLPDVRAAAIWAVEAGLPDVGARCVIGLQFASRSAGRTADADLIDQALALGPEPSLAAWLDYCRAVSHLLARRDPEPAIADGVAAAQSGADPCAAALLLGLRALHAVRSTASDEAERLEDALSAAKTCGVAWIQASAHSSYGIWHSRHRRWQDSDASYARAQHLFRESDHLMDVAVVLASRAVLESSRARTSAAIRAAAESARIQQSLSNTLGEAYAENTGAVALMMAGQYEASRVSFARSAECFAQVGATGPWHFLQAGRAELAFREGQPNEAREGWERATLAGQDLGWAELQGMALAGLAMVDALEDGLAAHQDRFEEAFSLLKSANAQNGLGVAELRRCLVQFTEGDQAAAGAALDELMARLPDVEKGFGTWYLERMGR